MGYYNEQLEALKEQVVRKRRLTNRINDLRKQYAELEKKVSRLEDEKSAEQCDVERLEARSLANFFYSVVGRRGEMLTREKEEAYAASVKYDAAVAELNAVRADIRSIEIQLGELYGCEAKYNRLMEEKTQILKESSLPEAGEVLKLEEKLTRLKCQQQELTEAISAGNAAFCTAEAILKDLDSAEGFGTWDLLGGGLISDLAKHSHLDDAQAQVERLQVQLRRFKTELADVNIQADMKVNVDGFLCFADFFFDGLFADWAVLDKIEKSTSQVKDIRSRIQTVTNRLSGLLKDNCQEQSGAKQHLDELIRRADI